jgi:chromosome segregation ATPase
MLRRKIYTSSPAKALHGKVLDGFMLCHLADQYAQSINTGASLNIGDAWSQVSSSKNAKAVQDAIDSYERAVKKLEESMPLSAGQIEEQHVQMAKAADKVFRMECMGAGQELDEFTSKIADKIKELYVKMKETNNSLARAAAQEAIDKGYAPVADKVETNKFGSFKDYEAERQEVRKGYMDSCPDTPVKLEVLANFMEAKLPQAAAAIAGQVADRHAEQLASKEEEIKKAVHELETHKKQAAGELEEANTKLKQAQEEVHELGGRAEELKEEVERQRTTHAKQLEEETGALKKQLSSVKEDLEEQIADKDKKAKAAAAQAPSPLTQIPNPKPQILQPQAPKPEDPAPSSQPLNPQPSTLNLTLNGKRAMGYRQARS